MIDTIPELFPQQWLPSTEALQDDLRALTDADYDRASQQMVQGVQACSGVRMIAEFGHRSLPGVSDLDMLVVCDDAEYVTVVEKTESLRQEIPNGTYLFVHRVFVLPVSLVPHYQLLFFAHTIDELRLLWGDASLLHALRSSPSDPLLSRALWGSVIWRSVIALGKGPCGLRDLLLTFQNVVCHAALLCHVMGDPEGGTALLAWSKQRRLAVVGSMGRAREGAIALREAVQRGLECEWRMQQWCDIHGIVRGESNIAWQLEGRPLHFRSQRPRSPEATLPTWLAICATSLGGIFHPPLQGLPKAQESISGEWRLGLQRYALAVQSAQECGRRIMGDPCALFIPHGGMFPTPFNILSQSPDPNPNPHTPVADLLSFRFLQPRFTVPERFCRFCTRNRTFWWWLERLITQYRGDPRQIRLLQKLWPMPHMDTLALGLLFNEYVRRMPADQAYVNVGVWFGFSLLAGAVGNEDKRCIGIDNFSQFGSPREHCHKNIAEHAPPLCRLEELDYQDYFRSKHSGPIGVYYYDGNHEYHHQLLGLILAEPFFVSGTIIIVDDTNWPEPRRATEAFMAAHPGAYEIVSDLPCAGNMHPTWWNGLLVIRKI